MDEVDRQLDRDAPWDEAMIKKAREEAAKMPAGNPGECKLLRRTFSASCWWSLRSLS